jgi:hypothetical protein
MSINAISSAEIMNAQLEAEGNLNFRYIEVCPPEVELHVSIIKGWIADVREFLGRRI